ncbi:hypothetical protein [Rhodococcus sp. P1Y]|uniref:hypothetical protein n=1 Tax=Rhodococcus sp. P1Y TaxID=1302308 RepID=UPI003FA6CF80
MMPASASRPPARSFRSRQDGPSVRSGGDVVDPQYRRTVLRCQHSGDDGSEDPTVDLTPGDVTDHGLAGQANQNWRAELDHSG